ncbi:MAG: AbrB/MazE/SpoVT family DNA-binding domain-containing protein [Anaerolineales bacterium]|nr:AbrB/MazE/SpoVT family DNA-binding domain-containing protein [Anaerolineales bacterium]
MTETVRVQAKGQVTIPTKIRRKLNLQQGDLVSFVETKDGVLIKPAEVLLTETLDEIGKALKEEGITLEEWIERGREIRGQLLEEMYGLKDE